MRTRKIPSDADPPAPLRGRGRHGPLGFGLCEGRRAGERHLRQPAQCRERPERRPRRGRGDAPRPQRTAGGRDHADHRTQPQALRGRGRSRGAPDFRTGRLAPHADGHLSLEAHLSRRVRRREGRGAHRRLAPGQQKPRGRTGRAAGHGGQQRHGDALDPGGIRASLPLRTRNRGGRPGHRRPRHGQRDRPAARLPGCHDLHGRPCGRQGLRRRAVGAQNKGRRLGSGRAYRRRDPLRAAPLGNRRRGRGARHVGLSGGPHRADAS